MARYLGLDWDQNQLHLVAVTAGRGGVRIERAAALEQELTLKPAQAEEAGHRLRDLLKEAKIAAAPVIACMGRERFVLKELRYPKVSAAEEATLVRFQASKELSEPADTVVIDYTPVGEPSGNGEQRTFAVAARKELLACYHALCRAAGLKLSSLVPRAFGTPASLKRAGCPYAVAAVLTVTKGWAEFCVVRGDTLLFARSLAVGNGLVGEVRRNLAVYAGQPHINLTRDALQALYVAADGSHAQLREQLQELLAIPVLPLDPLPSSAHGEVPPERRAGFTGLVGILETLSRHALPVDFVHPKEPKPPENPQKKRNLIRIAVAAVLLVATLVVVNVILADRSAYVEDLRQEHAQLEARRKSKKGDALQIEALTKWTDKGVAFLDEFFDLTAYMESRPGFRVEVLTLEPKTVGAVAAAPGKKKTEDRYSALLVVKGEVLKKDNHVVDALKEALRRDGHRNVSLVFNAGTTPDVQVFILRADLAHRLPATYTARLVPPPPLKRPKGGKPAPPAANEEGRP